MANMKKSLAVLFVSLSLAMPLCVQAQDENAEQAAKEILRSLSKQEFKLVWEQKTSEWAHKNWSKDTFLASMSMGRPMLGELKGITTISREHTNTDQATGYEGDIYAIMFRSKYTVGEFYERVVVVKDPDGQYRLSGIFISPVPDK
jgi:Protein of unknown function (DUF4019)